MNLVGESRRTFVLGLIACVLGGYTYLTTPAKKTLTSAAVDTSERLVFSFSAEKIAQLDLTYDGKHLIGQRTSEGWKNSLAGCLSPGLFAAAVFGGCLAIGFPMAGAAADMTNAVAASRAIYFIARVSQRPPGPASEFGLYAGRSQTTTGHSPKLRPETASP